MGSFIKMAAAEETAAPAEAPKEEETAPLVAPDGGFSDPRMQRRHEKMTKHAAGEYSSHYNAENVEAFLSDDEAVKKKLELEDHERLKKWTSTGVQDMCECCAWPNWMRSFG